MERRKYETEEEKVALVPELQVVLTDVSVRVPVQEMERRKYEAEKEKVALVPQLRIAD